MEKNLIRMSIPLEEFELRTSDLRKFVPPWEPSYIGRPYGGKVDVYFYATDDIFTNILLFDTESDFEILQPFEENPYES